MAARTLVLAAVAAVTLQASSLTLAQTSETVSEPDPIISVLCLGDDALAVGVLQQSLESKLAVGDGYELRVAAEIAPRVGVSVEWKEPVVSDAVARSMKSLLEAAQESYYDGELDAAHQKLEELRGLQTAQPSTSVEQRVRAMVWHAAVYAARNQNARARQEARSALTLVPDLELDRVKFPPSAVALVQETKRTLETASVELVGLPPGAMVRVDRRDLGTQTRFELPVGTHELWVAARGFVPYSREIEITTDRTIDVALSVAFDARDLKTLTEAVQRGFADGNAVALLERLASRAAVDGWLLVDRRASGLRGLLWLPGMPESKVSTLLPATDEGTQALVKWAQKQLEPRVAPPPRPPIVGYKEGYWSAEGVWIVQRLARALHSSDGTVVRSAFNGTGPRLQIHAHNEQGWFGFFIVDLITYEINPPTFTLLDGSTFTGGGGASRLEVLGGHEWMIEGKTRPLLSLYGAAGIWGNRMTGKDIVADTGALGVFPNLTYSGLLVRFGSRFWIPKFEIMGSPLELDVFVWSSPITIFAQNPVDAFGESFTTRPVAGARGAAVINPGRWTVSLGYESERREIFLTGDARAAYDPPLTSVRLLETTASITIRAGRRF